MPRGGKRPGAGSPKGNLNALKHGRHSARARNLSEALAQLPEVRAVLLAFQRQRNRDLRRARRTAHKLFSQLLAGLPVQPDPEINQVLEQLQAMNAKLEPSKIEKNIHTPKLTIKPSVRQPVGATHELPSLPLHQRQPHLGSRNASQCGSRARPGTIPP